VSEYILGIILVFEYT